MEITDILMDHEMGVRCHHSTSPSPMDIACIMGNDKVLEVMLKYPLAFSPLDRTDSMDFPLFVVMKTNPFTLGHFMCFKHILNKALELPQGLFDSKGEHAIHVCLRLNRYECLEELLSTQQVWDAFSAITVERFASKPPKVRSRSLDGWDRFFHWMRIDQTCSSMIQKLVASRMQSTVFCNFLQWVTHCQADDPNLHTPPALCSSTCISNSTVRRQHIQKLDASTMENAESTGALHRESEEQCYEEGKEAGGEVGCEAGGEAGKCSLEEPELCQPTKKSRRCLSLLGW